ncbi:tRNA (adenosine(37)-N6)-threonylcarbamoyltransferase complex dimerization subunit type 1 TsaB [Novosphingobium sp. FSY-8]|uniref:tRNA (Adenosine(37)-N6)-threonylcarbamoyltransferase complex dimerization subunit type 1 TsaB n=1 Tax=Novosphingobium ovatum TaxID=1908523 RepID=A0ABW9XBG3_9SPHN|nr:tRNA (adenosine(37)-N6)-threonylcarbamoyltransferase complex dimerization subunit type 1 TsaB [Novosphingobium ovatum]NBC35870.1 tRNA (adenosine(37)-N6)-threonylcarbamoyltransferase complex dimerization subunit type 1 TsaB [Novosphingobium ovatum]
MSAPSDRVLTIECTTEACSVALSVDGALLAGEFRQLGRGHAEALVPMIAALPDAGRAGRIAVGLGPGSFTGVRIGLAAARALGVAWDVPVAGYPTLGLIAAMARAQSDDGRVLVATTGGHGEWFVQPFDADGLPLTDLRSLRPDDAAQVASDLGIGLIAGSQASALTARIEGTTAAAIWPDARQFGLLPQGLLTGDLTPLYGRAPDARLPGGLLPGQATAA